jgi:hypothetical protein
MTLMLGFAMFSRRRSLCVRWRQRVGYAHRRIRDAQSDLPVHGCGDLRVEKAPPAHGESTNAAGTHHTQSKRVSDDDGAF